MTEKRLREIDRLLRVAEDELSNVDKQRQFLLDQIASLKRERENLLRPTIAEPRPHYSAGLVSNQSSEAAKISLFRSLFRGREDVYARRFESWKTGKSGYQPDCRNEWLPGICTKPKTKCSHCDQRQFILSFAKIPSALKSLTLASPAARLLNHDRSAVFVVFISKIRAQKSN
jgi:hypothetical protein